MTFPSFIREQFDVTCHCWRIKLDVSLATVFGRECMDVSVFNDWLTYSTFFQLSFQFFSWTEPTILPNLSGRSNHWGTGDSMVSKGEIWIFDWHRIARSSSQNSFIQLSYSFFRRLWFLGFRVHLFRGASVSRNVCRPVKVSIFLTWYGIHVIRGTAVPSHDEKQCPLIWLLKWNIYSDICLVSISTSVSDKPFKIRVLNIEKTWHFS